MADFLSKLTRDVGQKGSRTKFAGAGKALPGGGVDLADFDGTVEAPATPLDPEQGARDELAAAARFLKGLGLFDENYYSASYPDVATVGADPFEHFFLY